MINPTHHNPFRTALLLILSSLGLSVTVPIAQAQMPGASVRPDQNVKPANPAPPQAVSVQARSPFAQPNLRVGPRRLNASQSVTIALRLPDPAALDAFLAELHRPGSPDYHRFLTPEQFTERFSPLPADVDALKAYLQANGLQIVQECRQRLWIKASGTVAQVQQAFSTTIGVYQDGNRAFFANDTAPKLPDALARNVEYIFGLDELPYKAPLYKNAGATKRAFVPVQIRTAYNLNSFYTSGIFGGGKTIAIFSSFARTASDTNRFFNDFVLHTMPALPPNSTPNVTDISVDGGTTSINLEADLDVENVLLAAPAATILFYKGPNTGQGQYDTLARIVNDHLADIGTESYGSAERFGSSAVHTLLQTGAAQGLSYFCASGDSGAAEGGSLSVAFPASDPNVIAVGGTTLSLNSSFQITSETGWNGSGGGISNAFSAQRWQANAPGMNSNPRLGITNPANSRLVPDVCLNASPNTGYIIYSGGGNFQVGGTSASSPLWAGATALIENYLDAFIGSPTRQGNLGPLLYPQLGNGSAFHDITVGNNVNGTGTNYFCRGGYDLVTGLGSANFFGLASALAATVSGTITLQGCIPAAVAAQPVTLQFRPVAGGTTYTRTVTLGFDNSFVITDVPIGTYSLWIKASKWLAQAVAVDTTTGAVSGVNVTLLAGDVTGHNAVTTADYLALKVAFGSSSGDPNYNAAADLTCDGSVTTADYLLLKANFGQSGAP